MAYNVLKGKVDFSGPANGSIENIVDDHSSQTINGVKTFSSTVSASAFYDTTSGAPVTPPAIVTVDTDGNNRVITSNGDGTATAEAGMTFSAGILGLGPMMDSTVFLVLPMVYMIFLMINLLRLFQLLLLNLEMV